MFNRIVEEMLRRKNMIFVGGSLGKENTTQGETFSKNLYPIGYKLDDDAKDAVSHLSEAAANELFVIVANTLKDMVGDDVVHTSLNFEHAEEGYKKSKSATEFSGNEDNSVHEMVSDIDVSEINESELKALTPSYDEADFDLIVKNLIKGNTSVSNSDKETIAWAIENRPTENIIPDEIPQKETIAFVAGCFMKNKLNVSLLPFDTTTDVLRLVMALSNKDVSLSESEKIHLSRPEARFVMSILDYVVQKGGYYMQDALRNREKFVRLAERIHPTRFKDDFPDAFRFFEELKTAKKSDYPTINGRIEQMLAKENYKGAVKLLKKAPGEFAKRIYSILAKINNSSAMIVVDAFGEVASDVPTPALLSLASMLKARYDLKDGEEYYHAVLPKSTNGKYYAYKQTATEIPHNILDKLISICEVTLATRFSELDSLGKVYIDPELIKYKIPSGARSESKSFRTLARGSRVKIKGGTRYIRPFIYWIGHDVDLSCSVMDENLKALDYCSFRNLGTRSHIMIHSGDITNAPKGASEFIDIDYHALKNRYPNAKYIMFDVISYSGEKFNQIEKAYFGVIESDKTARAPLADSAYNAKDVTFKVDLTAKSTVVTPLIYDIENEEFIWCDISTTFRERTYGGAMIEEMITSSMAALKFFENNERPELYSLFMLHAAFRATEIVDNPDDADTVFSVDKGITPYDRDIISTYLC